MDNNRQAKCEGQCCGLCCTKGKNAYDAYIERMRENKNALVEALG